MSYTKKKNYDEILANREYCGCRFDCIIRFRVLKLYYYFILESDDKNRCIGKTKSRRSTPIYTQKRDEHGKPLRC